MDWVETLWEDVDDTSFHPPESYRNDAHREGDHVFASHVTPSKRWDRKGYQTDDVDRTGYQTDDVDTRCQTDDVDTRYQTEQEYRGEMLSYQDSTGQWFYAKGSKVVRSSFWRCQRPWCGAVHFHTTTVCSNCKEIEKKTPQGPMKRGNQQPFRKDGPTLMLCHIGCTVEARADSLRIVTDGYAGKEEEYKVTKPKKFDDEADASGVVEGIVTSVTDKEITLLFDGVERVYSHPQLRAEEINAAFDDPPKDATGLPPPQPYTTKASFEADDDGAATEVYVASTSDPEQYHHVPDAFTMADVRDAAVRLFDILPPVRLLINGVAATEEMWFQKMGREQAVHVHADDSTNVAFEKAAKESDDWLASLQDDAATEDPYAARVEELRAGVAALASTPAEIISEMGQDEEEETIDEGRLPSPPASPKNAAAVQRLAEDDLPPMKPGQFVDRLLAATLELPDGIVFPSDWGTLSEYEQRRMVNMYANRAKLQKDGMEHGGDMRYLAEHDAPPLPKPPKKTKKAGVPTRRSERAPPSSAPAPAAGVTYPTVQGIEIASLDDRLPVWIDPRLQTAPATAAPPAAAPPAAPPATPPRAAPVPPDAPRAARVHSAAGAPPRTRIPWAPYLKSGNLPMLDNFYELTTIPGFSSAFTTQLGKLMIVGETYPTTGEQKYYRVAYQSSKRQNGRIVNRGYAVEINYDGNQFWRLGTYADSLQAAIAVAAAYADERIISRKSSAHAWFKWLADGSEAEKKAKFEAWLNTIDANGRSIRDKLDDLSLVPRPTGNVGGRPVTYDGEVESDAAAAGARRRRNPPMPVATKTTSQPAPDVEEDDPFASFMDEEVPEEQREQLSAFDRAFADEAALEKIESYKAGDLYKGSLTSKRPAEEQLTKLVTAERMVRLGGFALGDIVSCYVVDDLIDAGFTVRDLQGTGIDVARFKGSRNVTYEQLRKAYTADELSAVGIVAS